MALIFFLCASKPRKPVPPPTPSSEESNTTTSTETTPPPSQVIVHDDQEIRIPLPPPPPMNLNSTMTRASSCVHRGDGGKKRLMVSLSQRLTRNWTRSERRVGGRAASKTMDEGELIWKKQIILGEKCKVPSGAEEEEEVVYDGKGNKVETYHPRTSGRSQPPSRTNSSIDF